MAVAGARRRWLLARLSRSEDCWPALNRVASRGAWHSHVSYRRVQVHTVFHTHVSCLPRGNRNLDVQPSKNRAQVARGSGRAPLLAKVMMIVCFSGRFFFLLDYSSDVAVTRQLLPSRAEWSAVPIALSLIHI